MSLPATVAPGSMRAYRTGPAARSGTGVAREGTGDGGGGWKQASA